MTTDRAIIPTSEAADRLALAGQAANAAAAAGVFADYRARRASNTLLRQRADLQLFADFLASVGAAQVSGQQLQATADEWRGMTHGLIAAFVQWQLREGYAVGSIGVRLSTVKTYAGLAFRAGALAADEHALIRGVKAFTSKEGKRTDEKRTAADVQTRRGTKKAQHVSLTAAQVKTLKTQPDTPQGRRDALLMCLLLDHGLRCGEVARLTVGNIDLKTGELRFYRPKVDKHQTHRLSPDALKAARAYFRAGDAPMLADVPLLRESRKDGQLTGDSMTERAITKRVRTLGSAADVPGLSAHDCRHSWATRASRAGTDPFALQEAGGWNSLAMPRRYIEEAKIANEGVKLE